MSIPSQYRKGKKLINFHKRAKKRERQKKETIGRVKLSNGYFISMSNKYMAKKYLSRFRNYLRAPNEERRKYLSAEDTLLYWEVKGFNGFFDNLFHFTDLSIFDK